MTSVEFDLLLQEGTVEDRQRAALQLLDAQQTRLVLGNAVLSAIAKELKDNEQAILEGEAELEEALDKLGSIAGVLNTIGKFIGIVGRVVPLL